MAPMRFENLLEVGIGLTPFEAESYKRGPFVGCLFFESVDRRRDARAAARVAGRLRSCVMFGGPWPVFRFRRGGVGAGDGG
jgi:hypothetical protein